MNPKFAVKDTPEGQFEWAMSFFKAKDYKRAAEEFLRLVEHYKNAKQAPEAQYYAARSYRLAGKYYGAFQNYQRVVKNFPFSERIEAIIKEEYDIGEVFYNRSRGKLMGKELMVDLERAVEVFTAIVDNMPYSKYADQAQYMIGMSQKKMEQYSEAAQAFTKMVQEYPKSELIDKARYELAQCLYLASSKSDYDQEGTDEALDEFKRYSTGITDGKLQQEANATIAKLKEQKALSIYNVGQFYERQKKYASAGIYYRDVAANYGDTPLGIQARDRLTALEKLTKGKEHAKK
ncbi:MAG: outer membrane protein assembly factor BamD [Candidatus Omnitrophica bacterium]|nr:outer membrane protein assembly factor BamD [Candidatus Omnitrophota bacterium]